jgi:hypothetical protein
MATFGRGTRSEAIQNGGEAKDQAIKHKIAAKYLGTKIITHETGIAETRSPPPLHCANEKHIEWLCLPEVELDGAQVAITYNHKTLQDSQRSRQIQSGGAATEHTKCVLGYCIKSWHPHGRGVYVTISTKYFLIRGSEGI